MALEDIFSKENILGYSSTCLEMAMHVPENLSNKKVDTLVIPSRGAVPIFLGMVHGLEKLYDFGGVHSNFYDNLGVQEMLASLLPEESGLDSGLENKNKRVLLVPFTADLNIPKYDNTQNNDEYTQQTREYWANVTKSFFKSPSDRVKNPYFSSFMTLLEQVEERDELVSSYKSFPKINQNFAMMDTVISGRASNHILGAFDNISEEEGSSKFLPQSYLVIDEDGHKLQKKFNSYLRKKELVGQVKRFLVPRIVSEDEGASLLGVSAFIYPSIMRASKSLEWDGKEFFIGAGTWHLGKQVDMPSRSYSDSFKQFMNMVYSGIDFVFERDFGKEFGKEKDVFENKREGFVDYAHKNNIIKACDIDYRDLASHMSSFPQNPFETSSHVVHLPLSTKQTDEYIKKVMQKNPQISYRKNKS